MSMSNAMHLDQMIGESASKNPDVLMKYFSPDVEILYRGQFKGKGLNKLISIFVEQWTQPDSYVAKIIEKRELPGQNAMQIKAEDKVNQNIVTTTYYMADVAGQKMIVKMDTTYEF